MFLRPKVSLAKTFDVGLVKRLELQGLGPGLEVAVSVALRTGKQAAWCLTHQPLPPRKIVQRILKRKTAAGHYSPEVMRDSHALRGRFVTNRRIMQHLTQHLPHVRRTVPETEKPGAFQLTLLKALELPKTHREVFLLKEIQGYTLAEIAAMLGISMETALVRWKRARREFMHLGDSSAMERQK